MKFIIIQDGACSIRYAVQNQFRSLIVILPNRHQQFTFHTTCSPPSTVSRF